MDWGARGDTGRTGCPPPVPARCRRGAGTPGSPDPPSPPSPQFRALPGTGGGGWWWRMWGALPTTVPHIPPHILPFPAAPTARPPPGPLSVSGRPWGDTDQAGTPPAPPPPVPPPFPSVEFRLQRRGDSPRPGAGVGFPPPPQKYPPGTSGPLPRWLTNRRTNFPKKPRTETFSLLLFFLSGVAINNPGGNKLIPPDQKGPSFIPK